MADTGKGTAVERVGIEVHTILADGLVAVSYTHVGVYKRQVLCQPGLVQPQAGFECRGRG